MKQIFKTPSNATIVYLSKTLYLIRIDPLWWVSDNNWSVIKTSKLAYFTVKLQQISITKT